MQFSRLVDIVIRVMPVAFLHRSVRKYIKSLLSPQMEMHMQASGRVRVRLFSFYGFTFMFTKAVFVVAPKE